ncbi:hypothetical protein QBZ16_002808 [Prototheca wickerhamii]|uniref:Uncharacterized protein n=1 Tax=Prototheca wickerhamii TaxID=3111 RepID=A0AAD9IMQ2_PROWI|nr:hypothetical protein QBZ16_002808 [Prototheca wickerhamii]
MLRAVVSATSYALDIATQNGPAELQPQDELALRSLTRGVDGCCTQPGTCKQLKELLAGSTPLLALCYRDGNLCDADGRLLALDLSHQDLGCANVPHQSLGQLSSLQLLDLTGTGLSGHVSGLVTLVRSLPDLRGIRAAHNELAGALDCALLAPGLSELDLAGNRLSGSVPPCFLSSQSLHHLRLSHNALAGELPTPTEACGLHTVRLDHMQLRGPLPDLSGASRLSVADLSHNRLTQPRKAAWPALLRSLRLAGNGLDESALRLPPWLAGATRRGRALRRGGAPAAGHPGARRASGDRPTAPGGPSAGPAGLWASAAAGVALAVAALLSIVLVGTLGFNARAALQRSASSAPAPLSTIAEEESASLSPASRGEEACTSARPVAELSEAGSDIRAYASAENLAPASSAEQELVFRRVQAIRRKATAGSDDERAYAESTHAAVARKISNKSDISDGLHADLEEENSSDGLRIRAWVKDANAKKDD